MTYDEDAMRDLGDAIITASKEIGKEGAVGMGAIEAVAFEIKNAGERISDANRGIALAINNLADAIRESER